MTEDINARLRLEEYFESPEGKEWLLKQEEKEKIEKEKDEQILKEHNYKRRGKASFINILPESMWGINPNLEWDDMLDMFWDARFEAFNWDETMGHTHMALKCILFRLIVPKDRWNTSINIDEFNILAEEFYKKNFE